MREGLEESSKLRVVDNKKMEGIDNGRKHVRGPQ